MKSMARKEQKPRIVKESSDLVDTVYNQIRILWLGWLKEKRKEQQEETSSVSTARRARRRGVQASSGGRRPGRSDRDQHRCLPGQTYCVLGRFAQRLGWQTGPKAGWTGAQAGRTGPQAGHSRRVVRQYQRPDLQRDLCYCCLFITEWKKVCSSRRKTMVFRKGAYSVLSTYLDPRRTRICSVLFWVVCMVHFSCIWKDTCVLNQVDGVEDQRGTKVKTS